MALMLPKMMGQLISVVLLLSISSVVAQSGNGSDSYTYGARFSPSMAIIIAVLVTALFFMGFFSIYIRRRTAGVGGTIRTVASRRAAAATRGLDASVLDTFPTLAYSEVKGLKIGKGALECAVCLNEFDDDETLRLIPKCDHVFHPECIDAWLASHTTCPVCRADLLPQVETVESNPNPNPNPDAEDEQVHADETNDTILVQIEVPPPMNRNGSLKQVSGPGRFMNRFRSHSTGHSLIQPGENVDRFTLRLPEDVRKQVLKRAVLNRTASGLVVLPIEGSSRRGFRSGEGSNKGGRSYIRLQSLDRPVRSDRWGFSRVPSFLSRALSVRSPMVVAKGEASTSSSTSQPV